jgi:hypothetical protein
MPCCAEANLAALRQFQAGEELPLRPSLLCRRLSAFHGQGRCGDSQTPTRPLLTHTAGGSIALSGNVTAPSAVAPRIGTFGGKERLDFPSSFSLIVRAP